MVSEVTKYLSETIGERRAGTEADKKAAEYIARKMKEIGLEVEIQKFKFLGWEMTRRPTLELVEPEQKELPSGIFMFSENTPEGGITGKLEYIGIMPFIPKLFEWPKYAVVDDAGNHLGYIIGHVDGPAINFTLMDIGKTYGCAPYIMTDQKTHEYFQEKLAAGEEIRVRIDTAGKLVPGLETQNVIGTLRGSALESEEIIVCAHHDSTYESHGANDNASGVDAVLRVAKNLIEKGGTKKTVKFITFAAEEYLFFGSYYYVKTLKEKDPSSIARIKNVVNLDMVGVGEYLWVWVAPDSFRHQVDEALKESIKDEFDIQWNPELLPASDHWPFFEQGIPSVLLIFWPHEQYHLSTDMITEIDDDKIEKTAKAATAIAERLAGVN
jgi:aminopeptidase YwaD